MTAGAGISELRLFLLANRDEWYMMLSYQKCFVCTPFVLSNTWRLQITTRLFLRSCPGT